MDFDELLDSIINPGPDGADPGVYDQLREAHHSALETARVDLEGANTNLAAMTGERDAALSSVVEVKAMNFDKLMAQGAPATGDPDLKEKTRSEDESKGEMETSEFFEKETH